jgi:hypothetical protein
MWWGDFMPDQADVDARSLAFTSEPLNEDLEILGFPTAHLQASVDARLAHWYVRLSDVSPDGQVTQITGAGLNGAHRNSAQQPEALIPGEVYELDVELHFTSWTFRKGHRIRISVSNAQWPMFWPTPHSMTSSVHFGGAGGSRIVLPVVPYEDRPAPQFAAIEHFPGLDGYGVSESDTVSGYAEFEEVQRDSLGNAVVVMKNGTRTTYPWATIRHKETITHRVNDNDPADAAVTGDYSVFVEQPDRRLLWRGVVDWHSDENNFYFKYTKSVRENDELLNEKVWEKTIPRDFQ